MRRGAPAYPYNSDNEVAAINRETRDGLMERELFDAADEHDYDCADTPTRPADRELISEEHLSLRELAKWAIEDERERRAWHSETRGSRE